VKRARVVAAWTLLIASLIGWPLSHLTFARDEPTVTLALSWLAIVLVAADLLTTAQLHEQQDQRDN
jgi:hypothetical protein